ncbi:MAG: hypothetical protein ABIQ31_14470 [Ferruginibacter sp.]
MKISLNTCDVITSLHKIGFTEDFVIHGDDILWVQKKIHLNANEFMLVEYHRFTDAKGREAIVFGVITNCYDIMGILIKHYDNTSKTTANIENKIDTIFPCVDKYKAGYFNAAILSTQRA